MASLATAPLHELDGYLPRQDIGICVFADRKSEPGEQIINGVWFPADEGTKLVTHLGQAQVESLGGRLS